MPTSETKEDKMIKPYPKRINLSKRINDVHLRHLGTSMSDVVVEGIVKLVQNNYRRRMK
jgi:hypothetical protein